MVVSFAWIYFSDHFLLTLASSSHSLIHIGIYKGLLFVFVTGLLIYYLTRNALKEISQLSDHLSSTQQRYQDLFSTVPIGLYKLNSKGQLTDVNSYICELVDESSAELIEHGWTGYIHIDDCERVKKKLNAAIKQRRLYVEQYRIIRKDIGIRWVIDTGHPKINSNGEYEGYQGTLTDITVKIESENEVIAKDVLLNKLTQTSIDSIALFNAEGMIINEYSEEFARLLGYESASLKGKNVLELTFPEDHKHKLEIFEKLRQEPDKIIRDVCRFKGKNDKTYWVDYSFANFLDDPFIAAIVGHGRDITERKQVELEFAQSESKFRTLVESSLNGIYLIQNGQFIYVNPELQNILGYTEEELYAMPSMLEIVHEDDRELVKTNLQKRVSGQVKTLRYPFRCRHKTGHTINVEAHGSRIIWKGQPAVIGTLLDFTDRVQMEKSLKQSEDRFHRALANIPDVIVIYDRDLRIQYINESTCLITNKHPSYFIGKRDKDIWPSEMYSTYSSVLEETLEMEVTHSIDVELNMPEIGLRSLQITCIPIFDEQGEVNEILGITHDFTEKIQSQRKLEEKEHQLALFIKHSPAAIAMFDRDMRYLSYSNRWLSDYKLDDQDLIGRCHYDVFPEISDEWKAIHQRCLNGAIEKSDEEPFVRLDGTTDWLKWQIHPWRDINENIGGIIMFTELITERKQAAENLVLFRTLIDRSSDAIEIIDPVSGKFLDMNDKAYHELGYTREECLALTVFDIDTLIEPDTFSKNMKKLYHSDEFILETEHQRKDGSRFPVEVNMKIIQHDRDYLIAMVRDITERKEAEKQKNELQEKLNLAISSANVGIWIWNLKTNKLFFSKEWKKQIGYNEDEIKDDYNEWESRLHPDDRERANQKVIEYQKQDHPKKKYQQEFRLRHKDGSYRWIMDQGKIKYDETGEAELFLGTHIDITPLKKAESAVIKSKERLDHVISSTPTVLYSLRVENNRFIPEWISKSITRISGYQVEEALQADFWERHVHPDDREHCMESLSLSLEGNNFVDDYRFLHKQGYPIYIHDECRILRDSKGKMKEIIGSWSDVTEQHMEQERNRLYTTAFENTSEGVVITGLNGEILSVNQAYMDICGYSEEELIGKNPSMLHSGKHDRAFYQTMWDHIAKSGSWNGEVWNRRKNGELYPQWLSINVVKDDQDQPSHYVGVSTDITQRKYTEEKLEHLAHYDALTDLPNSMLFRSRLKHAIQQAARKGRLLGILNIDLDDFKKINDSLGHPAGDELLLAVSMRWCERLRDEDTIARQGGDEFVILLEDIKKVEEAGTVAENLLSCLTSPFKLSSGEEIYVEASIGISIYPNDGLTGEVLLQEADTALFRSKELGRNQFSYYTSNLGTIVTERLQLETALRQAIEKNELLLHYQPKVDIHTGGICGAEALIRWNRPGEGLVPPDKFIPLAEKTGLIIPIGEWVVKTVCQQLASWIKDGNTPVRIAINIAARQFREKELSEFILKTLTTYKLKPEYLEIEITESALMENPDEVISTLHQFKELGIKISLDDFGTGYSNIAYLSRYPIDVLKIDASFVRNLETDPNALKLIKSVIKLAQTLGLYTIAEGVETIEQLDYLRQYNCNEIQGYYFSKPVSAEDFIQQVNEKKSLVTIQTANFKSDLKNIH